MRNMLLSEGRRFGDKMRAIHFLGISVLAITIGSCQCKRDQSSPPSAPQSEPKEEPKPQPAAQKPVVEPGLTLDFAKQEYQELRLTCETILKVQVNKKETFGMSLASVDWDLLNEFSSTQRSFKKILSAPKRGLKSNTVVGKNYDVPLTLENTFKVTPWFQAGSKTIGFDFEASGQILDRKKGVINSWIWEGSTDKGSIQIKRPFVTVVQKNPKIEWVVEYNCETHRVLQQKNSEEPN